MKILKSWLEEYIEVLEKDEEIADLLSLSGTAVESISSLLPNSVIVAEIMEVNKHPNADKLNIAKVNTGAQELQIVCGAPNIKAGQKVPLAMIGTVLGEDFVIKKANIRGIDSFGMLCAEDELGLGTDHGGIMILDDTAELGQPISKYIASDTIIDLEITPNRGDELSHLGIARELKALTGREIKQKDSNLKLEKNLKGLEIEIEDKALCMNYYAVKIDEVEVEESPEWLKKRLLSCGVRPINNIVDITNFVMLDLGQPMHAFDSSKVKDKIIVRKAHFNETIVTLDGVARTLDENHLVIADAKDAIALAGVMGGANSEISPETTSIILESAQFDPVNIRKTAKELGLSSEASYRFERGIDPSGVQKALERAAAIVLELAGGKIGSTVSCVSTDTAKTKVKIENKKINQLLNLKLSNEEVFSILIGLGFEIDGEFAVVPYWRHDVSVWQDLAEEVARIYGYARIGRSDTPITKPALKSDYYYKESIKDILVKYGFSEIYGYVFLSEKDLQSLKIEANDLLEVANPIQPENKYLRKSLIPSLLKAVAKNPTFEQVLLFEIAHAFTKEKETVYLGMSAAGKSAEKQIQAAIEEIANTAGLSIDDFDLRELSRDEVERFKIKKPLTYICEIEMNKIIDGLKTNKVDPLFIIPEGKAHYRPISKYPSVTRDLAFIVDQAIDASKVSDHIFSVSEQIGRVELFDEFVSDKFGQDKKNIAYHIYLQDMVKTMTDQEADLIIGSIVQSIEEKFDGKLRQF